MYITILDILLCGMSVMPANDTRISDIFYHSFDSVPGDDVKKRKTSKDSVMTTGLQELVVEADGQIIAGNMVVFRPDVKQKDASQTGLDLLAHIGIPMLTVIPEEGKISTSSDQPVTLFINKVKASLEEIRIMEVSRVLKVEYIDFPSDPRYLGSHHVVNFVIPRQEYGGYTKAYGMENFIADNGILQANSRLEYKKMTYDLMGHGSYNASNHIASDMTQYFNLRQDDGLDASFRRITDEHGSGLRDRNCQFSFRAMYQSPKFTASNKVNTGWNRTLKSFSDGIVRYEGRYFPESEYSSDSYGRSYFFEYDGNYSIGLSEIDALDVSLQYEFGRTRSSSYYQETGMPEIINKASDKTHSGIVRMTYSHSFGSPGTLNAAATGMYERNATRYLGSSDANDMSTSFYWNAGLSYSVNVGKFYGSAGLGWAFLKTSLNNIKNTSDYPYADLFLQFSPSRKHSLSLTFHHTTWPPSGNNKSDNIIQTSPFVWITGNPLLGSSSSYDTGIDYSWIPSNSFSFSSFIYSWIMGNREAYDYEAYRNGVLRTIRQPMGHFSVTTVGVRATTRQLNNKLQLTVSLSAKHTDNGAPFNYSRLSTDFWARCYFYAGKFIFGAYYASDTRGIDTGVNGVISGVWKHNKGSYYLSAGWSGSGWNIQVMARNFARWNWVSSISKMHTEVFGYYSKDYSVLRHATLQVSATYTINYGKKTDRKNELTTSPGVSSGILQ